MGYDARVRYTKGVIRQCFIDALRAKPLRKVTVREICEAAERNRATFYRYYDNPFDLMDKIEREYLTELTSLIGEVEPGRMRESLQAMLGFLKENRGDCLVLFLENGDPDFALRAIGECFQKMLPNLDGIIPGKDQAEREWLFHYMAQGCAAALGSWMRGGMSESVERLADFLVDCNTKLLAR